MEKNNNGPASLKYGVHFNQAWRTLSTNQSAKPLPADELLHRHARFIADNYWPLPVYEYPDRFHWDDDDNPRRLSLPWPEGFDYQSVLGKAIGIL